MDFCCTRIFWERHTHAEWKRFIHQFISELNNMDYVKSSPRVKRKEKKHFSITRQRRKKS